MTSIVHVVHGRTLRDRPALTRQLQLWRQATGASSGRLWPLVVLGSARARPGVVVLPDGIVAARALRRWLQPRRVDMLVSWDARSLKAVAGQSMPCVAVLDGLIERACQTTALKWMRDRRMPVLVTSPSLGDRIDAWTQGRARVRMYSPRVCVGNADLDSNALDVVSEPPEAHRVRPALDPLIRLGLAGRAMRCVASRQHGDWAACDSLLRSLDLPGLKSATAGGCAWAGGASPPTLWRGTEPVLALIEFWARGSRLLLPQGHAAASVLGVDDGSVVECDVRAGAAADAMEAATPPCTRVVRHAAWQDAGDACFEGLYSVAQHS